MTLLAVPIPESLFGSLRKAPLELAREIGIPSAIDWKPFSADRRRFTFGFFGVPRYFPGGVRSD